MFWRAKDNTRFKVRGYINGTRRAVEIQRQASRRGTITDKYMAELSRCSDVASAYIPPIAIAKSSTGGQFGNEQRRVVVVFLSLPNTQKGS